MCLFVANCSCCVLWSNLVSFLFSSAMLILRGMIQHLVSKQGSRKIVSQEQGASFDFHVKKICDEEQGKGSLEDCTNIEDYMCCPSHWMTLMMKMIRMPLLPQDGLRLLKKNLPEEKQPNNPVLVLLHTLCSCWTIWRHLHFCRSSLHINLLAFRIYLKWHEYVYEGSRLFILLSSKISLSGHE